MIRSTSVLVVVSLLLFSQHCQTSRLQAQPSSKCEHQETRGQQARTPRQQRQNRETQQATSGTYYQQPGASESLQLEHEEFSLAAPQTQPSSQQAANASGTNYTNQPGEQVNRTKEGVQLPSLGNTTPALPSDSIGSPVGLAPPATTSASAGKMGSLPAPAESSGSGVGSSSTTNAPRQQSRRLEAEQQEQQVASFRQQLAQPLSSSPSSISIITPLLGPPGQSAGAHSSAHLSASVGGQPDAQSMMKPIFVLGNPLSERDYTNQLYSSDSNHQKSGKSAPEQQPEAKFLSEKVPQQQPEALPPTENSTAAANYGAFGERMSGPPLVYNDGQLSSVLPQAEPANSTAGSQQLSPRFIQSAGGGAAVLGNNPRRPSLPPPVNQANAASGFRSPLSPSGPLLAAAGGLSGQNQPATVQSPLNQAANFYQSSPPYAGSNPSTLMQLSGNSLMAQQQQQLALQAAFNKQLGAPSSVVPQLAISSAPSSTGSGAVAPAPAGSGRRPSNITRVEHISAECSNDLIRAVIVFNGTFRGMIYSSGYVNDPTCLYVNGSGLTRYEFTIRLNQCGTLGREQLHQPTIPGEARRRDQVMYNTLSIQYNSLIEQEWDEHFRVSCEYGSDFWKTVSFSPFNVETNTGSPVVFTINPPQCQMDVLLGHGIGPKIVDGPVTVGDPLTLLIHMKSEKAGYDILVKNCVAHNGGKQRMQLIDNNGCVVNERFISPFRGTYNDNDLRHVTLYAYLKAFRFTGSPVLYLECEIHMCQSACPPQMCYWRRLSKRSVDEFDYEYTTNRSSLTANSKLDSSSEDQPVISDSLNLFKALQVRHEPEPSKAKQQMALKEILAEDEAASLVCYGHTEIYIFIGTIGSLLLLVVTIALVCCLRVRKLIRLDRSQMRHSRILAVNSQLGSSSSSLSPSLLSISDADSILTKQNQKRQPLVCHFSPKPSLQTSHYY